MIPAYEHIQSPPRSVRADHLRMNTASAKRDPFTPKYNIPVKLVGEDGNAFNLMGIVAKALQRAKVPQAEIDQFIAECKSGDYDNLLVTCMQWVDVA